MPPSETIYPCVQCGFCCTISNCTHGKWDKEKHQCAFLNDDSTCAKYEEIKKREKNSLYPMMGSGCSSPLFNERRNRKITFLKLMKNKTGEI